MDGTYLGIRDDRRQGARVLLAMSGGVDSAVAAVKLRDAGFDVVGVTMKNYCYGEVDVPERSCCSLDAIDDARAVCARVGVRHLVVNTEEIFGREVYGNFLDEYRDGRTPNPCVRCNSIVRFDTLLDYARRLEVDYVATGHYARLFRTKGGRLRTARPVYLAKDQSYFLSGLHDDDLARVIFPLGDYHKPEVRAAARDAGLDVADKPESQEVCFIPEGTLRAFLDGKVPMAPGDIEDTSGRVLGRHPGLAAYTVGQRRGLGISAPEPLYVVRLDRERNVLVVGTDDELFESTLSARLSWFDDEYAGEGNGLLAQIRSRQSAQPVGGVRRSGDRAVVRFAEPQRAVAPGQTIAFYDGDVVVGSGVIEAAGSSWAG
jgi:tRNA-specific 2-thiouridylase